jgi:NitT/TauT family transport system substrate-binding protein
VTRHRRSAFHDQEEPALVHLIRRPSHPAFAALLVIVAMVVAACGGGATPSAATPSAPVASSAAPSDAASPSTTPEPASLTVGLGFIPSVQFAQFYLAQQAGYYADAGLTVTLQNKIDPDLITLLGQGAVDIGSGDGTSVIPAVSQGIPVVYAATIYGKFPSVVIAKADSGISAAADLKGRKIGIPGKYGSSWIMLQALLESADLTVDDVEIVEYPDFGQASALQQGAVDAATGFANNEPIQLRNAGIEPVVLTVDEVVPLPGPGLVTGTKTLAAKHDALQRFTDATLRAMDEIAADPQKGYDASVAEVPELATKPDVQKAILAATIDAWEPVGGGKLGAIEEDAWQASIDFLEELKLVPKPVRVEDVVDLTFLPS